MSTALATSLLRTHVPRQTTKTNALRSLLSTTPTKTSDYPHKAVPKEESSKAVPNKTSTTETMMPWEGWFSSFLKSKLGPERYQKLRENVLWKPDDIHDLHQIPNPMTKIPISKDDPTKTAMFRYPSPGSQPAANIPKEADPGSPEDDPYNIAYYPKDTRRRYTSDPANVHPEIEAMKLELLKAHTEGEEDERITKAQEILEQGPGSSPGNKGAFATGKSDFDPSMLRATMSANHEAMNKSLDAHMPDHLPTPEWFHRQDEIIAWYEERGLHIPLGGTGDVALKVDRDDRIARW